MKFKLLIFCQLLIGSVCSFDGGTFDDNHFAFIEMHLPKLLQEGSGRVALLGLSDIIHNDLCKKYPFIRFEEFSIWNKKNWNEIIKKNDLRGVFDCVVAMHLLEREPDRDKVLQTISNLLKPRGKVLMYVDPQNKQALDQRIETSIRYTQVGNHIPIIPSLSISEYQVLVENLGFSVLEQSDAEYKIYLTGQSDSFWEIFYFACPRWHVPAREPDEDLFCSEMRDCLRTRREITRVPNSWPIYKSWTEDTLPTYYFILQNK